MKHPILTVCSSLRLTEIVLNARINKPVNSPLPGKRHSTKKPFHHFTISLLNSILPGSPT